MHNRFFIEDGINIPPGNRFSSQSIASHVKAFRKKAGDDLRLYDGSGNIYNVKIIGVLKKETLLELVSVETVKKPISGADLFLPFITSHVMDQLIARVCELDVGNIFPVFTERSIRLRNDREIESKLSKWNKISKGSMVIAGKNFATSLNRPVTFNEALDISEKSPAKIIAHSEAEIFLKDYLLSFERSGDFPVSVFIGPEGDFSPAEIKLAADKGLTSVRLSRTIMSTFVASLYAVSNITCFNLTRS